MSEIDTHVANFRQVNGRGPAWMHQLREQGLSRFAELGFPTPRLEEWKYTNVAPLAKIPFRLAAAAPPGPEVAEQVRRVGLDAGDRLVFVNGRHAPELSRLRARPAAARVESLAAVLRAEPALAEPHLGRYADHGTQSLTALNTAFIQDGAFVYVPKEAALAEPIHVVFVSTASGEAAISHPRNLIVAEEGSRATVVETYVGQGHGTYCTNAVTEIAVGPHASLTHYTLQRESEAAFHIHTVQARQAAASRFWSHAVSLGGGLVRTDINTVLDAEGSLCTFDGLYVAAGRQHVDHHTSIDHRQPRCRSRELYKGVLDGHATGVFNGKVFVRPDAQKSDAGQVNKNLLLSEAAVINTKPQLEIFADDVKCSHGATIGRLDADAVFYLRSRGLDETAARNLLVYAFANELIDRMKVEDVRAQLERVLRSRFQPGSSVEGSP